MEINQIIRYLRLVLLSFADKQARLECNQNFWLEAYNTANFLAPMFPSKYKHDANFGINWRRSSLTLHPLLLLNRCAYYCYRVSRKISLNNPGTPPLPSSPSNPLLRSPRPLIPYFIRTWLLRFNLLQYRFPMSSQKCSSPLQFIPHPRPSAITSSRLRNGCACEWRKTSKPQVHREIWDVFPGPPYTNYFQGWDLIVPFERILIEIQWKLNVSRANVYKLRKCLAWMVNTKNKFVGSPIWNLESKLPFFSKSF